ncbi:uncharacterized protein MELLADRAFT_93098 [Melampsora larici-populina 98AG31]|uniref:Uncharacterized protein n=1 Tax=Melampsora larici-populina (strain 98AG31 / pathotype 3-4-7) TaxID=747676 RepID=F4S3Y2_MELLP|nr:uncharacterized protein MELLADRAFT_93098 [Melampsora larici-populina 98AG31]EGG00612.1 hypothetical protein MELLADRAFT_93098 [Melampsora larici-populina 98AG31]
MEYNQTYYTGELKYSNMAKRKGSKSPVTSPKNEVTPTAHTYMMKVDSQLLPTTQGLNTSTPPKGTNTTQQPSYKDNTRPESSSMNYLFNHPLWPKIQTLPETLHVFLRSDFDSIASKTTNLDYHRVLYHFDPKTKSRPSHTKAKLKKDFDDNLKPLLLPFAIDPPKPDADASETSPPDIDFDPLHRRTTRAMLSQAILSRRPGYSIASDARIDQILILYKAFVDPDLLLPVNREFIHKPKCLTADKARQKTIEYLRFALQCHAPHIFVHSVSLTHPLLLDLYIKFVIEDPVPDGRLVCGYHYSEISDMMTSLSDRHRNRSGLAAGLCKVKH